MKTVLCHYIVVGNICELLCLMASIIFEVRPLKSFALSLQKVILNTIVSVVIVFIAYILKMIPFWQVYMLVDNINNIHCSVKLDSCLQIRCFSVSGIEYENIFH
jgi:hypothetical protein